MAKQECCSSTRKNSIRTVRQSTKAGEACCPGQGAQENRPCACGKVDQQAQETAAPCGCGSSAPKDVQEGCGCTAQTKPASCGCEAAAEAPEPWVTGYIQTPAGLVPQVATRLRLADRLGSWKARWSIGRMDYKVNPGLYGVGRPGVDSPVLVTANYKMTFDRLRMELGGLDAWIMVLDTKGINVWCAAGKGTFGTEELVRSIKATALAQVVTHRELILPQLGAPGIAAHEVAKQSGFRVAWGPVRASDLPAFLSAGKVATREMRTVQFTTFDRLVLTPMELVGSIVPLLITFGVLFLLNAIGLGSYGWVDMVAALGAILAGCLVTPVLLPWIPGRAFAFKGFVIGLLWAVAAVLIGGFPAATGIGWLKAIAFLLLLPSVSAFGAMNFTGSSTYTSASGVNREMKIALPLMVVASGVGILLLLVNDLLRVFG